MENNKLKTFIGFALKSRKLVTGTTAITFHRNVKLLFVCHSISENGKKEALKMARRYNVPLVQSTQTLLDDLVHKTNCKMFAVLDDHFKEIILKNIDESYKIIFRGEKDNERD